MLKRVLLALVLGLSVAGGAVAAETGSANSPAVLMETSMGTVKIQLDPQAAPISVKNFLDYVNAGFYDGTIFHRVIPNFMVQGGGFTPELHQKKVNPPIKNEAGNGLKNDRGTIAMARTMIVNSATAQFFINVKNNDFLNHQDESMQGYGFAVFGKVVEGMDVVDQIAAVQTGMQRGFQDVPMTPVVIKSLKLLN